MYFEGLFPRDNPRDTRFAINFFTSIGLGGLTLVPLYVSMLSLRSLYCSYSDVFFLFSSMFLMFPHEEKRNTNNLEKSR